MKRKYFYFLLLATDFDVKILYYYYIPFSRALMGFSRTETIF